VKYCDYGKNLLYEWCMLLGVSKRTGPPVLDSVLARNRRSRPGTGPIGTGTGSKNFETGPTNSETGFKNFRTGTGPGTW